MKNVEKKDKRSTWGIISTVLTMLLTCIAVFSFAGAIILKLNNQTFSINNKETRLVISESMGKCDEFDTTPFNIKSIEKGDAVIIEKAPSNEGQNTYYVDLNNWVKENVTTGDVLTFSYMVNGKPATITHRVIDIKNFEDGYQIKLQGDFREKDGIVGIQIIYTNSTNPNAFNYLIGEVIKVSSFAGFIMTLLTSKILLVILIIVPCCGIIIYNIIRIIVTLKKDKEEKELIAKEERNKELSNKDKEIEELKKQLEEQKKGNK